MPSHGLVLVHGQAPVTNAAPAPLLRVKTSALPISVTGQSQGGGTWHTERDDDDELRLKRRTASGTVLATLVARQGVAGGP